jgi:capsular polysaccharide biosynthesis protein
MEVASYLRIIARYWWVILLTALVSTGVALAITVTKSKSYTVHARVVAQPSSVLSDTRILTDMSAQVGTRTVVGTLAQVFTSAEVRADALKATGMSETQALDYPLEANVLPDSSVIEVIATGHDPELLANYVNATVDAAVKHGSAIYRVIELAPLERAQVPTAPTSPVPARDIPFGAGLGLLLGVLLAFTTEYMRTPRRQEGEMQLRALPTNTTVLGREERIVVNGAPRQDYLPGRQQRPGSSLPPGRRDDSSQS